MVSNLKIRLSFGLVLGNPILYLFGTRIKIKSNEDVYNKQYYNHDENMYFIHEKMLLQNHISMKIPIFRI
jgi:hypothetical protein